MAAEVDATRRAQRQLLADVRHDLRTPLTVIGGFSEALRDGTASGEAAERAAAAISDEAGRLERMLADLDHLTMPGSDGPADAPGVARRARPGECDRRSASPGRLRRGGSRWRWRRTPAELGPRALVADRDALDRILGNLVANALAHAPSPGGDIRVEVRRLSATDGPDRRPGWLGRSRRHPAGRARRWAGHPAGGAHPRLRPLLPGRPGPGRPRLRSRPGHRARPHATPWAAVSSPRTDPRAALASGSSCPWRPRMCQQVRSPLHSHRRSRHREP